MFRREEGRRVIEAMPGHGPPNMSPFAFRLSKIRPTNINWSNLEPVHPSFSITLRQSEVKSKYSILNNPILVNRRHRGTLSPPLSLLARVQTNLFCFSSFAYSSVATSNKPW
jgi:hypothetical protein